MKLCSNCNKFYKNEDLTTNFCPYCGMNYSNETNINKKCKKCNEIFLITEDNNLNYCPYCGEKFEDSNQQIHEIDKFELDHYENKKKYILGITLYFAIFYVVSIIFTAIISFIWMAVNNITSIDHNSPLYGKFETDVLAWGNFSLYIAALAAILPFSVKFLIKDIKEFKKNPGLNFKWFGFGVLIMYAGIYTAAIIVELLSFGLEVGESANQQVIESIFNSGGINLVLMLLITIIFAPVLEEIVFRKFLFGVFKKNTFKTVILSTIIFAAIHVIPACINLISSIFTGDATFIDLYLEFIYIFQYLGQAFAFAFMYHKTKGNLIPCIILHFLNNFISLLGMFFIY